MYLSTAIDSFLDYLKTEKCLSEKSLQIYSLDLDKFYHFIGDKPIKQLTLDEVLKFKYYLKNYKCQSTCNKGQLLQPSSIEMMMCRVKTALFAFFRDSKPPFDISAIKIKKIVYKRKFALTEEELDRLLKAPDVSTLNGLRDRVILELFISTGLRLFEMAKLDRGEIDFGNSLINIMGKGGRSRTVYISSSAMDWLKKYLKTRTDNNPALFINPLRQQRYTQASIKRLVPCYAIKAGIPKNVSTHILRHSYATLLLQNNVNLYDVKELMGHSDIRTTQVYLHTDNRRLKEEHHRVLDNICG